MSDTSKTYSYVPAKPRTQRFYDEVCRRFDELREAESINNEARARHLSNAYYMEIIAEEFSVSVSSVRNIVNSRSRR